MNDKRFQRKLEKMRMKGERQKAKVEVESKYAEYYPHREGAKVSNVMLVIIVIAVTLYTIASFVLVLVSGINIDPTLTTCFYGFWGTELALLAGLKVTKTVKERKNEDKGDVE